jgi:hypothetical protein
MPSIFLCDGFLQGTDVAREPIISRMLLCTIPELTERDPNAPIMASDLLEKELTLPIELTSILPRSSRPRPINNKQQQSSLFSFWYKFKRRASRTAGSISSLDSLLRSLELLAECSPSRFFC